MKFKVIIDGSEKEVILTASSSERDVFLKKSTQLLKAEKNEEIDLESRAKVAIEFTTWLQELALSKINLNDEEKKKLKDDIEQLDIIIKNLSDILKPFGWEKKNL